ncbi:MucR family transcriptional regulator [Flexibacterium corallicola]|uniref:MucR family transcriptional regulator n=1 Tax=Flexibacterium corallicola TaxID=3037259 RepID=UPI00286FA86D|nr:MucR family transcriptional regulator [Pseudovibrio sp. M1P-2-3]
MGSNIRNLDAATVEILVNGTARLVSASLAKSDIENQHVPSIIEDVFSELVYTAQSLQEPRPVFEMEVLQEITPPSPHRQLPAPQKHTAKSVPVPQLDFSFDDQSEVVEPSPAPAPEKTLHKPVFSGVTLYFDGIICLEDNKKVLNLREHLKSHHNMRPQEYRDKWKLPETYPMIAPSKLMKQAATHRVDPATSKLIPL